VVPKKKWDIVDRTRTEAKTSSSSTTTPDHSGEKYNKVVDAWSKATDEIGRQDDGGISR